MSLGWYIGIDPGQLGGLALVSGSGRLLDVVPMPAVAGEVDGLALAEILTRWNLTDGDRSTKVILEQVHSMPGQGVSSTFKFGKSFGILIGATQALKIPMERVTPQKWKKEFELIGKDKDASRHKATELWPAMAEKWKYKKENGKSDAALIAEWGRRTL